MRSTITKYLDQSDWRVKENSNMGYSLQGLSFHVASTAFADYWLNEVYPSDIADAHKSGLIHIHDLGALSTYCCGWDLKDLLVKGFDGVPGKVASKPPKHFSTALGQLVNFFYTLQGESAGAQAVSNFDTLLAPFVFYDGLGYKEVKQYMQEFLFNMNVPTRVGFQCPFTNITMDLSPSPVLIDEHAIVGGKMRKMTYRVFQHEMDMINKAFAEVMLEGDAKNRVFSFPIPTYNITKDFDWDNPAYDGIWKMASRYGIPYFANFVNSDMSPEDTRSMCCRLRLDNRELRARSGGIFAANPLTGSIGVVTINLPHIALQSSDIKDFYYKLINAMAISKASLEIKREKLETLTENGLYPYAAHYLRDVKERTGKYWSNHFSTIGLIGMNEALEILAADGCWVTIEGKPAIVEYSDTAREILSEMRKHIESFQEITGNLYNLEATPAEGATYRLAKIDKASYDLAFTQGTESAPYYTNSTQLPVGYTTDIFEALDHQNKLQTIYTGGTVFHGFLGEQIDDFTVTRRLVKKISNNYSIPYFTLTPTFSICDEHGYIQGNEPLCPQCGAECEVWSRVVGYLRPVRLWNDGKKQEFEERTTYS